jgi:hypothetical protein
MEDDLNKLKNGRQPNFFLEKVGRRIKNMEDLKTNEWKTTSKKPKKWKTTSKNKLEDEPINQNQPNWL